VFFNSEKNKIFAHIKLNILKCSLNEVEKYKPMLISPNLGAILIYLYTTSITKFFKSSISKLKVTHIQISRQTIYFIFTLNDLEIIME